MEHITEVNNGLLFDNRYNGVQDTVERNADLISEIVNIEVHKYTQTLDELIDKIRNMIDAEPRISDYELEIYIARIPVVLYYIAPSKELAGIREDTAKMIRTRMYTEARQRATGTVADRDGIAEQAVAQETLTTIACNRITRTIQSKCDMALELLSALKKICSKRIEELQLSQRDTGRSIEE